MKTLSLVAAIVLCTFTLFAEGPQHRRTPKPGNIEVITPAIPEAAEASIDMASVDLAALAMADEMFSGAKEHPDDPGYTLYKEGYDLILDESWKDARKKFAEVISKHPKSEYVDDAAYWSAYAMRKIDRKKAIKEYKEFIAKYPNSTYFDDAVADLSQLAGRSHGAGVGVGSGSASSYSFFDGDSSTAFVVGSGGKVTTHKGKHGFAYTVAPNLDAATYRLNSLSRRLSRIHMPKLPRAVTAPTPWPSLWSSSGEKVDEKTQLKMDALSALGDNREDSISYKTLRDVAIDVTQPKDLRMTALDVLSDYKKFDVLPIFLQVAKMDPDEEVQNSAIDVVSNLSHDKNRSVDALIELYNSLPVSKKDQRETIFYTIADIGNDKAVDFLAEVAKSSDDYDLRSQAVYYLGSIGGEKARAALYGILKGN